MKKLIAAVVMLAAFACSNSDTPTAPSQTNAQNGSSCSAQGNGNTVICAPTPSPTPADAVCVPQTGPFVCQKGVPTFQAVLESVQAKVPDAPEPIYMANLAKALNEHKGIDGKRDICAQIGYPLASDEVGLKAIVSNVGSETWDVKRADGTPQALYVHTCNPSQFSRKAAQ